MRAAHVRPADGRNNRLREHDRYHTCRGTVSSLSRERSGGCRIEVSLTASAMLIGSRDAEAEA